MNSTIIIDGKETVITPEMHNLMRFGHKPRLIPDEMDEVPEDIRKAASNLQNVFNRIKLKTEKAIEKQLKAAMFFFQDYNPKHYTIVRKEVVAPRENDNVFRNLIESHVEYHKPSRNGHRRNYTQSDIYKEYAIEVEAKRFIDSNPFLKWPSHS